MSWDEEAACRGEDPNLFFPQRGKSTQTEMALAICARCTVIEECAEAGRRERMGIWGGKLIGVPKLKMAPALRRQCLECKEWFDPYGRQQFCSSECARLGDNRRKRRHYLSAKPDRRVS